MLHNFKENHLYGNSCDKMSVAVSGLPYVHHEHYFNLRIAPTRAVLERHLGLLYELRHLISGTPTVHIVGDQNTVAYKFCVSMLQHYEMVLVSEPTQSHNLVYVLPGCAYSAAPHANVTFVLCPGEPAGPHDVVLAPTTAGPDSHKLCVRPDIRNLFVAHFVYELKGHTLHFNNLVNLCIMVKNAGPLFKSVLEKNMKFADRWTILDTGSTDETLDTIQTVLQDKYRGTLFQEPFVNFRESRNRCLDLAGKGCKYNIMLDDTYVVRGNLRQFLEEVRGDEFGSSFSFYIKSDDTEYTTNRITRTELGLRYIFKIHEVIQSHDNVNVMIPRDVAYLDDLRAPYMEERTMARKQYDLKLLLESIEEEPNQPRHLYYTAQTYGLLDDPNNAAKYFKLRAESELEGFKQERVDAWFELARINQFKLGKPWSEVEPLYLKVLELEPLRIDAMYFLGIYHIHEGRHDEDKAFLWFAKAFPLGYPMETQYSLKPTLAYYFLPRFLAPMCYTRYEWQLGLAACQRFLTHWQEPYMKKIVEPHIVEQMSHWHQLYSSLVKLPATATAARHVDVVFVVDGNWSTWTGADIESKGLGGSETWAVEMATHFTQAMPHISVVFFCRCDAGSVYKGVEFVPMQHYEQFLATHHVGTCIVSRFSEYLFAPLHTLCDQVILYIHDLGPTGNLLPTHPKLKAVYCLSPWHRELFMRNFPSHSHVAKSLGYGIDSVTKYVPAAQKQKHSFIFSSFPNRGLLPLLRMWPRIKQAFPDAVLNVFCDLQHSHVRSHAGAMMGEIDKLLEQVQGVVVRGWVNKASLAHAFSTTEYWLYPCIFDETFCLTALEAVSCGVIGIAPPRAALQHMPLVFVEGDAMTPEWQDLVVEQLVLLDADTEFKSRLVSHGRQFAQERPWKRQCLVLAEELSLPVTVNTLFGNFATSPREVTQYVDAEMVGRLSKTVTSKADYGAVGFNYVKQWLHLVVEPREALLKYMQQCEKGMIETPSPMVELMRGVDQKMVETRGYALSNWFVWTERADNSLHFLPKLPMIEALHFPEEHQWMALLNKHPLLWSNCYAWDSQHARSIQVKFHDAASVETYRDCILRAVELSMMTTRVLFSASFLPHALDGACLNAVVRASSEQHLAKLSDERVRVTTSQIVTSLEELKASGVNPRVVYDIGACVLEWCRAAQQVWPDARVIVFDAMPQLASLYTKHGVEHYIALLGEEDGVEVDFYENVSVPFGNSRFKELGTICGASSVLFKNATKRVMTKLDTLVRQHHLPLPEFIKLDVQGSEHPILVGGRASFAHASHLIVELQDQEYNEGAPTRAKVVEVLHSLNFQQQKRVSAHDSTPDYLFVNHQNALFF